MNDVASSTTAGPPLGEATLDRVTRAYRVRAECGRALVRLADETALLRELCRIAVESGGYRQAWVAAVTRLAPLRVLPVAYAGYGEDAPMRGAVNWGKDGSYRGLAGEAIEHGETRIARDILNNPREVSKRPRALALGYQSSIALLLRDEGRVYGAVVLHAAERDAFDEEEIALLTELAVDFSYGIANIRTRIARQQAEQSLRETERRAREMMDQAAVGITRADLAGLIVEVNQKFCDMLGYSRDELIGRSIKEITHPDDQGKGAWFREQVQRGTQYAYETGEKRFVRKDGTAVWTKRTMSAACDDEGRPEYLVSVIEDITERKLAEETIANERALLRSVVDAVPERIYVKGRDGRFLLQNTANVRAHGATSHEELLGKTVFDIFPRELAERVEAEDRKIIESGRAVLDRERVTTDEDGRRTWVVASKVPLHDAEGNVVGIVGVNRDITARKQAEQALGESEEQFRQLASNIPQVFWLTDIEQRQLIYVSPAFETLTGEPVARLKADPRLWLELVHAEDRERVREARLQAATGAYSEHFRVVRADGTVRWVHDRAVPVRDESGKPYRIAGITEDVTERRLAEQQLEQLAHYDALTGLPNRALFYDRLKQALAQARRNEWTVGVMFIDVDRFKTVNDTLGHAMGDILLRQISDRLVHCVRAADTVGRLSGDEFAIVLCGINGAQDANTIAQKLMARFNEPFRLETTEVFVTASIGITLCPDDGTEQEALLRNADAAMYRAKEAGRNAYQFYTAEMNARALQILDLQTNLRRALERNEFLLYYQPRASLATGRLVGMEALLRWRHPERGLIAPAEFIPVLEETGLIGVVGDWVIRTTCAQINEWARARAVPVPVAVNISARQFQSASLGTSIVAAIKEAGIDPALIEIEITESSLMLDADAAVTTLEHLRCYGLNVSIDDFGTGYSSLAYLKRFPLHALKIDRSFVGDIAAIDDEAPITRAVISMARSLGLKVVAEGVETETQLAFLAAHGCDEIQGYYLSPPLPAGECLDWLRRTQSLLELPGTAPKKPAARARRRTRQKGRTARRA